MSVRWSIHSVYLTGKTYIFLLKYNALPLEFLAVAQRHLSDEDIQSLV